MDINNTRLGIYSNVTNFSEQLKLEFEKERLIVDIFDNLDTSTLSKYNYLIINSIDNINNLDKIKDAVRSLNCRIIVLLPLGTHNNESVLNFNFNLGVLLLPTDIENIVISDLEKVSKKIVKETFSFGITGQILSLDNFVKYEKKVIHDNEILLPIEKVDKTIKIVNKSRKKIPSNLFKKLSLILLTVVIIVLVPLFLIFMSLGSLYMSYKTIENNNKSLSYRFVKTSRVFSQASKSISFGIPFYYNLSNLFIKSSGLGEELLSLITLSKGLMVNITGDKIYDLELYSNGISASLDKIYTDISFLQSDINEQNGYFGNYIRKKLNSGKINIGVLKNKIYQLKNLSSRMSNLLGLEKPKKYLILFQNNMELRPTGGFIGSFAIVSFDKGRLTEIVVNDVYTADGQLKGHVDPPEPILKYLGEGGWYFRDSNWDPDFRNTSSKVEWFLDKEIDVQVDGVIAIDLYFIQSLLKITGPINLVDFKKTIDENNLYQTTQSEVESEFFPGSIKKASFLTSLSKNLITEVENLPSSKYFSLFREIYKSLEERHIQVFLHDLNAQNAISQLGFSGEIDTSIDCGLNCIQDNYSLIDANLGVNKANYFIERSQEVDLIVNREHINHELVVKYNNNATNAVGARGLYKSYTRLLIPQESTNVSIKAINSNGDFTNLEFDSVEINNRKEFGFLLEVLPGGSQKIQIVWDLPNDKLKQGGEYKILIRKQAGTDNDGLKVNVVSKDLSLTGKALPVYNTTLARDFSASLFFK